MHTKKLLLITITLITTLACSLVSGVAEQTEISPTTTVAAISADEPPAVSQPESQAQPASGEALYLFAPNHSTDTYLMNSEGAAMYTWTSVYNPGNAVYLLENGNLLRTGTVKTDVFDAGGSGGIVQEIAPDSSVVWEYRYADDQAQQHHDIEQMPDGNILMIAWEYKTRAEAIAAGREPGLLKGGELWPDHVIEVDPATNEIVWEWHIWDHLVQDHDPAQANYGMVTEHPELININFISRQAAADWNHINSIDYNAELDQIVLSVHNFSEIWIIDHGTTTEEAAGAAGDLLYRWGNPQTYDAGTAADQQFYVQHDAQWIPSDYPGEGNILVFNNGEKRSRSYSSIDEITPPLNPDGSYTLTSGSAYGPEAPVWTYVAENPADFFADHISGAQRLPNGNTLICSGTDGVFFEVTPEGEVVWRYDYGRDVFRVTKISADDPRLAGLNLQPGETLKAESGPNGQPSGTGQPPGNNGPPQRARDACADLAVGAACSFENPKGTVSGSCQSIQGQLTCVPEK